MSGVFHETYTRTEGRQVKYKGWSREKQSHSKINPIVFSGRDMWNLGDKFKSDLANRATSEARRKYCLL